MPGLMKIVKSMKELDLRALLAGNKLYVIDEKDIDFSIFLPKCLPL